MCITFNVCTLVCFERSSIDYAVVQFLCCRHPFEKVKVVSHPLNFCEFCSNWYIVDTITMMTKRPREVSVVGATTPVVRGGEGRGITQLLREIMSKRAFSWNPP